MATIRKLIRIGGDSRAVVIPADWLKAIEERLGHEIEHVLIESDLNCLTIMFEGSINTGKETQSGSEHGDEGLAASKGASKGAAP